MVYLLFSLMDSFHIIFICYCSAINNLILLKTILNVHKVYIFKKKKKKTMEIDDFFKIPKILKVKTFSHFSIFNLTSWWHIVVLFPQRVG